MGLHTVLDSRSNIELKEEMKNEKMAWETGLNAERWKSLECELDKLYNQFDALLAKHSRWSDERLLHDSHDDFLTNDVGTRLAIMARALEDAAAHLESIQEQCVRVIGAIFPPRSNPQLCFSYSDH